jgi:hypothetical protein
MGIAEMGARSRSAIATPTGQFRGWAEPVKDVRISGLPSGISMSELRSAAK